MDKTVWGEQIVIDAPGGRIAASIHYPPDPIQKGEPVVMLHGLGGNRHEHNGIFTRTAAKLAESGFITIRFDFCGNGESEHSSEFMTLDSMMADLEAVIEFIGIACSAKEFRCSVLGLSLGGLVAAYAASQLEFGQSIKRLVLWEPPFNLISTLKRLYGPLSLDRVRARGHMQAGLLKLNSQFVEQFKDLDCETFVPSINQPVLLLQGDADQVVTVDDAQSWQTAFKQKIELQYISGGDHAFSREEHALEVIDLTVDWISQQCSIDQGTANDRS